MQVTTEIRGGSLEMGDGAERINGAQREIARFCSLSSNAMEDVASRAEAIHGEVGEMAALSIAGRDLGHQLEGAVGRFIVNEGS